MACTENITLFRSVVHTPNLMEGQNFMFLPIEGCIYQENKQKAHNVGLSRPNKKLPISKFWPAGRMFCMPGLKDDLCLSMQNIIKNFVNDSNFLTELIIAFISGNFLGLIPIVTFLNTPFYDVNSIKDKSS